MHVFCSTNLGKIFRSLNHKSEPQIFARKNWNRKKIPSNIQSTWKQDGTTSGFKKSKENYFKSFRNTILKMFTCGGIEQWIFFTRNGTFSSQNDSTMGNWVSKIVVSKIWKEKKNHTTESLKNLWWLVWNVYVLFIFSHQNSLLCWSVSKQFSQFFTPMPKLLLVPPKINLAHLILC